MAETIRKKLIVVGDAASGISSLLNVFNGGDHLKVYMPIVFINAVSDIQVDGKRVELSCWDTAGQEEYDRLRPLGYPGTNVVVMCFSIESPESLENIRNKWIGEIRSFCGQVPIILVGLKNDLRNCPDCINRLSKYNQKPVTYEEGEAMCREIKAQLYLECSAKLKDGVTEVFEEAARTTMEREKKQICNFM